MIFHIFFQSLFLGPSAFSEFTNFFNCGVYTGSHAHQQMRLEKLVWKNTVSARDLEYEIKIFQKTIFKSVRRPFSSWSDRTPFSYQHAMFFCGPFAFWEFMSFFKSKVFRGSHTHQWMRLEKLVRKKEVSARNVESEIKIFQKTCSDPVRRPFSSWSDRRPFSIWKGRRPFSSWTDRSLKRFQMFLKPSWNV